MKTIETVYDKSKCVHPIAKGYTGCNCTYCDWFKSQKSKWIVDAKSMEVSVVRETSRHGIASYGWGGPNKKIIATWNHKPDGDVKTAVTITARALAKKLNQKEGHIS